MKKENRVVLIILSVLSLLNVVFVPIFDVWGGLMPDDVDENFFDVISMVFSDSDCWEYWVVLITISIFIPSVFMLIMSLLGKKKLYIVANAAGIVFWLKQIISFGMEDDGFEDMFDFDDGSISIGTWIAIIIFVISLLVALSSKKKANTNLLDRVNASEANSSYMSSPIVPNEQHINQATPMPPISTVSPKYCPQCGKAINAEVSFCGSCGFRIS